MTKQSSLVQLSAPVDFHLPLFILGVHYCVSFVCPTDFWFLWAKQGAVVLVQAAASSNCKLKQLQMHGCGIADSACIQKAIQLRAAEALETAKPKKKAKKKKKAGKGKEEAAGKCMSQQ